MVFTNKGPVNFPHMGFSAPGKFTPSLSNPYLCRHKYPYERNA